MRLAVRFIHTVPVDPSVTASAAPDLGAVGEANSSPLTMAADCKEEDGSSFPSHRHLEI
jgi:hypothetical protein